MVTIEDIRRPVEKEFGLFEQSMRRELQHSNPLLGEVLQHIHSRRGKQLRPLMVLLSAKMCHGVTDKSIDTAVALEMLHTASLLHDDVVDNSPVRRGIAAVQAQWNNKTAILTGDYLFSRVMEIIAGLRTNAITTVFARMSQTLAEGELLQLHESDRMWISEEQYMRIIEKKTACLFAACMESGAQSSCGTMRQTSALRDFGMALGMCFQMKDDVLDYSDSEEIGKPTMHDIVDGKATLPLLISLQRAPHPEAEEIRGLCTRLSQKDSTLDIVATEQEIKSFVLRYDGIRYAYKQMQQQKDNALQALSIFHDSSAKESLLNLLDYAIYRVQ